MINEKYSETVFVRSTIRPQCHPKHCRPSKFRILMIKENVALHAYDWPETRVLFEFISYGVSLANHRVVFPLHHQITPDHCYLRWMTVRRGVVDPFHKNRFVWSNEALFFLSLHTA